MGNAYANLSVSLGVGVGASVDTSSLAADKTIIVGGTFNANLVVEASHDGVSWSPVATFAQATSAKKLRVAACFMRVRTVAYTSGTPTVDVAAPAGILQGVSLTAPAGNGSGPSSDATEFGQARSIFVGGTFTGSVTVEGSNDNSTWSPLATVSGADHQTIEAISRFMRVTRANVSPTSPGLPTVGVCATSDTGVAPNVSSTGPVIARVIYARTTGSDDSGDGSLTSPYATFLRAIQDVPLFIPSGDRYIIDITGITESLTPRVPFQFAYTLPNFVGDDRANFDLTPGLPTWQIAQSGLTIRAQPVVFDSVAPANIVSQSGEPTTSLRRIVTNKVFTPGALKGKMIMGAPNTFAAAAIYDNTATDILVCSTVNMPTTFDIVDPGATLTGASSALFCDNLLCGLTIAGVFITTADGSSFSQAMQVNESRFQFHWLSKFRSFTLTNSTLFILSGCVVDTTGASNSTDWRIMQCQASNTLFLNARFDNVGRNPMGQFNVFAGVFDACSPVSNNNAPVDADELPGGGILLHNVRIASGISDGVQINGGGWRSVVRNSIITGCARDGVRMDGICQANLTNVQGTGNTGIGVNLLNGAQARRLSATAVTGTGGDYKVGGSAATAGGGAGWAAFPGNVTDLGAGSPQLCRLGS